MISSRVAPASRFSNTRETGIRVPLNTQAPLTLPGMLSTAEHCDQSRIATRSSVRAALYGPAGASFQQAKSIFCGMSKEDIRQDRQIEPSERNVSNQPRRVRKLRTNCGNERKTRMQAFNFAGTRRPSTREMSQVQSPGKTREHGAQRRAFEARPCAAADPRE